LLGQSRLAQFYQVFCSKGLVLVTSKVLAIFYQDLCRKALLLVIPKVLEIFYQDLCRKVLLLVIPTVKQSQNKKGRKFVSVAPKMVSFFAANFVVIIRKINEFLVTHI
jgi:hypothetical protein